MPAAPPNRRLCVLWTQGFHSARSVALRARSRAAYREPWFEGTTPPTFGAGVNAAHCPITCPKHRK